MPSAHPAQVRGGGDPLGRGRGDRAPGALAAERPRVRIGGETGLEAGSVWVVLPEKHVLDTRGPLAAIKDFNVHVTI